MEEEGKKEGRKLQAQKLFSHAPMTSSGALPLAADSGEKKKEEKEKGSES